MVTPRAFAGKLKVDNPILLKNGLPYVFHEYWNYDFVFKSIHVDKNTKGEIKNISPKDQQKHFNNLKTKKITKPIIIGVGSFPTDKGCNALAASLLYNFNINNKTFRIFTFSSLLITPKEIIKITDEIPEVICILDVADDSIFSIENTRAIVSAYRNSIIVVSAITKNIADLLKHKLNKTGIYLQFASFKKVEEV